MGGQGAVRKRKPPIFIDLLKFHSEHISAAICSHYQWKYMLKSEKWQYQYHDESFLLQFMIRFKSTHIGHTNPYISHQTYSSFIFGPTMQNPLETVWWTGKIKLAKNQVRPSPCASRALLSDIAPRDKNLFFPNLLDQYHWLYN